MIAARNTLRLVPALRQAAQASVLPRAVSARTVTTLSKQLYTAHGQARGEGRNGKAALISDQVGLEVNLG